MDEHRISYLQSVLRFATENTDVTNPDVPHEMSEDVRSFVDDFSFSLAK
jgi:hypothetical protein